MLRPGINYKAGKGIGNIRQVKHYKPDIENHKPNERTIRQKQEGAIPLQ